MPEIKYREFFELSLDLLCIAENMRFVEVNPAWETVLGWNPTELTSTSYMELVHPDDRDKTVNVVRHLNEGKTCVNFENRYRHKNGSYRSLLWTAINTTGNRHTYAVARDITDIRAEAQMFEEQQERIRLAQQVAKIGFWDWDVNRGKISWDDEMRHLYGLEAHESSQTLESWRDFLIEEDRAIAAEAFQSALQRNTAFDICFRINTPNGGTRSLRGVAEIYRDEHGNPVRMLGANLEISDVEKSRHDREKRLIVEAAPIALLMTDADGKIIQVNRRVADLFGYSMDELMGKSLIELVPETVGRKSGDQVSSVGGCSFAHAVRETRELTGKRKDGSVFSVELGMNVIVSDNGHLIIAAIADITGRKALENKLKEREKRLSQIVDAAPLALLLVNSEGNIVHANIRLAEMFGYTRDELIGAPVEILVPQSVRGIHGSYRQGYLKTPTTRSMGVGRDLFGVGKDGSKVPVEVGLSTFTTDDGIVIVVAVADIKERKKFEEDRERILEELKRSNAELEQFAYVVSHDLRAPLVTISGFTKKLGQAAQNRSDQERHYLNRILANVGNMEGIINDLLLYSRAARQEIEKKSVQLAEIISEVIAVTADQWKEKNARITVQPNFPEVKCHPEKMFQVLTNLLSNALKYSKEGEPPQIEFGYKPTESVADGDYVFYVKDNGIGIPEDQHNRVFKMFERINPREEIRGTGLGLAICKSIVEKHGGHMSFESKPLVGSTFYFTLPNDLGNKTREETK